MYRGQYYALYSTIRPMAITFQSYSFGCRVNQAEKQYLDAALCALGLVQSKSDPDFYILNSCTVTKKAEREVRQHIYQTKKKYPHTTLIVTGCAATLWTQNDSKKYGVDVLVNNQKKYEIPEMIRSLIETESLQKHIHTKEQPSDTYYDVFLHSGRKMVKLQDGCHRFCTYCIVPYTRGKPVSRTIEAITKEVQNAPKQIKEVILTAINTEYFGKGNNETLPKLLDELLNKTDISRISFGSIHPWSFTKDFFSWYKNNADNPRFVHYFHIPIQSASDTVLRIMNRQYLADEVGDMVLRMKSINPNAYIGTDIIVGCVGESEKEFAKTHEFLKKAPIDRYHVFRYSTRSGTSAEIIAKKHNEPTSQEKITRSKILRELSDEKNREFLQTQVGRTASALILERFAHGYQDALFDNQAPLKVKTNRSYRAKLKKVTIVEYKNGRLIGKIVK